MSTNISVNKENDVGPRTPKTLMKKQIYNNANNNNSKPGRSQASRIKRLPLASKDSNRPGMGPVLGKEKTGLTRNASMHLKKYGSILYPATNNNDNNYNSNKSVLPKVKSLVLKDIDIDDNANSSSSSSDNEDIERSLRNGNSLRKGLFSQGGLSSLLEQEEQDREIEYGPIHEKELEYVPDGIEPLQLADLRKLNEINIAPMSLNLDEDNDSDNNESGPMLMELQNISDDSDEDISDHKISTNHRSTNRVHDASIVLQDIDSVYHGNGLDSDDIADLLS
ncbi:similar to Saccharomyces cerevisiae YDR113C PDS1 Securin, inhibits anaphase by binding separin Esp1p [Maudiozyma saulgeensis]|uniref:Similar to Saccharomyces cerevisiae YDR113C PDS1 Securin, inhibits anaphase by binding separin Esp1p n=1 Tax=Maudiozyma saulgeensis TaxID=1789683 RepID=A0A1X7R6P7_9SACH|nr:similar to Saccharomyces cerevisiae YDR113C PDS1 Securin, inhibits anaphase by binding separin Esp1p [Kazachstania saulgeensis]